MSGIDDLLAESNERWASARRRAQGIADNGLGEALKIYYTRYFPSGLLVLITLGTLGGMLVTRAALSEWPSYLLFGWFLAAIGVLIGGLTYNAKRVRPAAELGRTDVLLSLASQEQKQVRRQILGKAPIEPEHLIVARGSAVQMRKAMATQLILIPLYSFIFIPQALNFLMRGDTVLAWVMGMAVLGQFIAAGQLIREFRRTGIFLTRTAAQSDHST